MFNKKLKDRVLILEGETAELKIQLDLVNKSLMIYRCKHKKVKYSNYRGYWSGIKYITTCTNCDKVINTFKDEKSYLQAQKKDLDKQIKSIKS